MTEFFVGLYLAGLALMLIGLISAPAAERKNAKLLPTVLAYLLWPLSLLVVLGTVAYERWFVRREAPSEHAYG
jgi:purine-cytosine permease-like protein